MQNKNRERKTYLARQRLEAKWRRWRWYDWALLMKEDPACCCHVIAAVCRFGRKDPCYCAALAYCCSSSRSQVDESLPLAWQKIGALGVSVFCSFFTVFRPPLLFLHLLCNELLLAAERKGEWRGWRSPFSGQEKTRLFYISGQGFLWFSSLEEGRQSGSSSLLQKEREMRGVEMGREILVERGRFWWGQDTGQWAGLLDGEEEYVVAVLWLRGRATGKPKREPISVREKGLCWWELKGTSVWPKRDLCFLFKNQRGGCFIFKKDERGEGLRFLC